jgi:hypothetical protein
MTEPTLDDALGEQLRGDGIARADAATDDWWRSICDAAIAEAARRDVPFQSYDLVTELGIPEPSSGKFWGPRFSAAAKAGIIRYHSYAPSKRPTVAGSIVRVWVGCS